MTILLHATFFAYVYMQFSDVVLGLWTFVLLCLESPPHSVFDHGSNRVVMFEFMSRQFPTPYTTS